jgi:hypothetical protein
MPPESPGADVGEVARDSIVTFYIFPDSVMKFAEELRGRVEFAWGAEVIQLFHRLRRAGLGA